ncbi:hypothetical protein CUB86_32045 [Pseudomonas syringae pv. actinidiae]|uniref:Uncharacterized protein n=1 Tax=Pseudomonas syringae pv. actinidiae TaxID=103796 RepID=A0AAU8XLP1_PSESF|nr:hypothetical protein CT122_24910 [Pseudomonas syringae pv. actinidiae]PIN57691.1 hypothetical protein CUB86_32045 [Pseudomonas syringae pv. actinidiae]
MWERTRPRTAGNRQRNQPTRCARYNQGGRFWAASQPIANKFAPSVPGMGRNQPLESSGQTK